MTLTEKLVKFKYVLFNLISMRIKFNFNNYFLFYVWLMCCACLQNCTCLIYFQNKVYFLSILLFLDTILRSLKICNFHKMLIRRMPKNESIAIILLKQYFMQMQFYWGMKRDIVETKIIWLYLLSVWTETTLLCCV